MREVNRNVDIAKIQKQDIKFGNAETIEPAKTEEKSAIEIKDFSNPTELLGRSQVSKTDNNKTDVAFGVANPAAIERSDKLFEMAFKGLQESGDPNAYEKACAIATSDDAKELLSR